LTILNRIDPKYEINLPLLVIHGPIKLRCAFIHNKMHASRVHFERPCDNSDEQLLDGREARAFSSRFHHVFSCFLTFASRFLSQGNDIVKKVHLSAAALLFVG